MDIGKLLRILNDLLNEEQQFTVDTQLGEIRSNFSQNTADGYSAADTVQKTLVARIEVESIAYNFSPSENIFLEHIGAKPFFGVGLISHLRKVFRARSYEMISSLDTYRTERNEFIAKIRNLVSAATAMEIEEYRPPFYEIGIIFPAEQDIEEMRKQLRDFNILLSAITESVTGEDKPIKIVRLTNGSSGFFCPQDAEVAFNFATFLADVATVWTLIRSYQQKNDENEHDENLSKEVKEGVRKVYEQEAERIKKKIIDTLPDEILKKLGKSDHHEIRNKIKVGIKATFAWIQAGIFVDVTPIRMDKTASEKESAEVRKVVKQIQDINKKLENIYKLPLDQKKLLFTFPEVDPQEEDGLKKSKKQKES